MFLPPARLTDRILSGYLLYADCKPDANNGFVSGESALLDVDIPDELKKIIPPEKFETLVNVLAQDPRPRYIDDEEREFGMSFARFNVKFRVSGNKLTVTEIEKIRDGSQ